MAGRGSPECSVASLAAAEAALQAFSRGEFVLLTDDEGCCSLALAAQHATAERVAFLVRNSTGIVRACLAEDRLRALGLQPSEGEKSKGAGAWPSVDFKPGVTTGVSAKDRAATLQALCDESNQPFSFSTPGHVFISCAAPGGVSEAWRCAEAAHDLCRLTQLAPVAVLAEPMREDGALFAAGDAESFARARGMPMLTARQLCEYRRSRDETGVSGPKLEAPRLETESKMYLDEIEAECMICVYSTSDPKVEIVAITKGDLQDSEGVPARIHSECFTGDILASQRCDCGQQLHKFLRVINQEQKGVLLYIRGHEGRGIGLSNKIRAYKLQDQGVDTVDANVQLGLPVDTRTYDDSLSVLRHLGVKSVKLYTNNPDKMSALKVITSEVVALASIPCKRNMKYLQTKRERLNHRTVLDTFKLPKPSLDMSSTRIGLVFTTWNQYYVDELMRSTEGQLHSAGVRTLKLAVPGASELISGARALLKQAKPDAIIVLGILIRGASDIYDATCTAVMTGLTELNASQDTPIVLGVLMCHDEDQAHERTHGKSNPGKAWADTALHMSSLAAQISNNAQ